MNLQETIALIGALKEAGATHFKSNDFEVHLGNDGTGIQPLAQTHESVFRKDAQTIQKDEGPIDQEKTQKIEDVIDLLKMKDDQLLDKIFPEGAL